MKTYRAYFRSGLGLNIKAHKFVVIDGQHGLVVRFYSSETDKIEDLYIPVQEVICVAPEGTVSVPL